MAVNSNFFDKESTVDNIINNTYHEIVKGNETIAKSCSTEFPLQLGEYNESSGSGISGYGIDLI